MRARIEDRLAELRNEYRAGQEQLQEVVVRENALRETLLRISGAIQVLEELTDQEQGQAHDTGPSVLRSAAAGAGDAAATGSSAMTVS